jgi:hypothetical protein
MGWRYDDSVYVHGDGILHHLHLLGVVGHGLWSRQHRVNAGRIGIHLNLMVEVLPILQPTRRRNDHDGWRLLVTAPERTSEEKCQESKAPHWFPQFSFARAFHSILFLVQPRSPGRFVCAFNIRIFDAAPFGYAVSSNAPEKPASTKEPRQPLY